MQSATNTALRTLDSLKAQLEFVEQTVKERLTDVPKDVADRLAEQKKQIEELQNKLVQPDDGLGIRGPGATRGHASAASSSPSTARTAAPTPAMRDEFNEVQTVFTQRLAEVNNYLTKTVPELNDALRRLNAPTLMLGKPIEMPKL